MGDDSPCAICPSKFSLDPSKLQETLQDKNFSDHLEKDVLKPKIDVGDRTGLTFGKTSEQNFVKYDNGGKPSKGRKRNVVPLKQYRVEDDYPDLKDWLKHDRKMTEQLGKNQQQLRRYMKDIRQDIKKCIRWTGLTPNEYVDHFHELLWMEEYYNRKELEKYNLFDVELIIEAQNDGSSLYCILIEGLSDGRPSIIKDDTVHLHRKNGVVYEGRVKIIKKWEDKIYVALNAAEFDYQHGETLGIELMQNRRCLRLCHRALDQLMRNQALFRTIFPVKGSKPSKQLTQIELEFVNQKISNDAKQVQAIKCILGKTCSPAPYIIDGPPGTGKTATLVEVIHQLYKRESTSELPRICICAQSNPAVDVIVKRLLDLDTLEEDRLILPSKLQENVIRIYARGAEQDEYLKDFSTNEANDVEVLKKKRIIATTTWTAGWLVDKGFGKDWFDYIFIDEASQTTEPSILIPIAGFMNEKCFLVLAGDRKQLGPVVTSPLAKMMGLDVSLLERLQLPKRDSLYNQGKKNRDWMASTILNNNYRSHRRIIEVPNKLFYHGLLQIEGDAEIINLASNSDWEQLPLSHDGTSRHPIIFHGINGKQRKSGQSPSSFNVKEIIVMSNYIEDLLGRVWNGVKIVPDHIGIITPYRTQVEMIKKYLNHRNWVGIRVGTVDSFQGSERLIMFISTVRSSEKTGSEFLRDKRRFNVAITRAMALLIVIGDGEALYKKSPLYKHSHWRELIDKCQTYNSCKGILPIGLQ